MEHSFRHKDGYITITRNHLYITTKEKVSHTNAPLFQRQKLLFGIIYFVVVIGCVWVHSLLLLAVLTAVLGVSNLSSKRVKGYKIPIDKILGIDKTGRAVILKFHNEECGIVVQKIRKISHSNYKMLLDLI